MLSDRDSFLDRTHAAWFIYSYFMRRLLQAMIILILYSFPICQILGTLSLNMAYLCLVIHFKPFAESMEQTFETINEFACLITIYFMLLFVDLYIYDAETRGWVGLVLMGITGINFLVNMLPVLIEVKQTCRRSYAQRRARNALA